MTYPQIISLAYTAVVVASIVLESLKIFPVGTTNLILAAVGVHAAGLLLPTPYSAAPAKEPAPPAQTGAPTSTNP